MKLNALFTPGAVLAAHKEIRFFGEGTEGGKITFNGITKEITTEGNEWCVSFPPMEYGGPYTLTLTTENEEISVSDIYLGEVYLFSGQSNMTFPLYATNTPAELYEENERLSLFSLTTKPCGDECWKKAKIGTIENFSALGYLVGNAIAKEKNIAVGIILCSQGASALESWVPAGTLARLGINIPIEEKHLDHWHEEYGAWNAESYLFNERLIKFIPYSLSGAVWYQGESDASEEEGKVYERMLKELIRIWRELFKFPDMPFTIVQLADTHVRMAQGPGWRMVQEAQARAAENTKNAYLAISRDVSETDDIHPKSKLVLAERITDIVKKHYFDN